MICYLAKLFLKDYDKVGKPGVRQGYGIISGVMGIAFNVCLFLSKLFAGLISGSVSILGDAFNNLSDAASSIVTLVGFKLSGEEADEEHPFGHGRLEYISGLIVALLIIIMGLELAQTSVKRIINPEQVEYSSVVGIILIISIIVKLIMFQGNLQASARIESAALKATAMDSISDVLTTLIVLISNIIAHFTGVTVDGFVGVIVALFIMNTGVQAARDTINPLLGEPPSAEFKENVINTVMRHNGILGVHDLVIHNYGPSRIFMSLHVEVPADKDIITVHDMIDDIEDHLRKKYHCTPVIHMDPVATDDKETLKYKEIVSKQLKALDPSISFHDFRVIHSEHSPKKITCDVEVPYGFEIADEKIIKVLTDTIKEADPDMKVMITVDKEEK